MSERASESSTPHRPLQVVVADDHPLVRGGLTALLGTLDGMQVVGEAADGAAALRLVETAAPDVVVMDLGMPGVDGVEATRRIVERHAGVAVLILTMSDDDRSLAAAMRVGARGYLLKDAEADEVAHAVRAVARGELVFGPGVAEHVRGLFATPSTTPLLPELSDRERAVLTLMAAGLGNARIGARLSVSPKTVANHASSIFAKLRVSGRVEAIARARAAGLVRE